MSLNTECDICGKKYTLPSNAAGDILECKECGAEFEIPLIPWWRSLFEEHADSTATFRSIMTAGCAALVLFLVAIAIYELTRESVTHRNEQVAQATAPTSPAVELRNQGAVPDRQPVAQNNTTGSTTPPPYYLATAVEPTATAPRPQVNAGQFPAIPSDARKPAESLAAQFARSASLSTQITGAVADARRTSVRITGRGLDRVKQLLLIPTGGKPISTNITSRSDAELIAGTANSQPLGANVLPAVEVTEALMIGYPTYALELRTKPKQTVGAFYIPEFQRFEVFHGIYHLLVLPQATLAAAPNGTRGDIATIIVLRGAQLADNPSFSIGCWVSETGATKLGTGPDLNRGIQASLEFPNVYLCPIPAMITDTYRNTIQ